MKENFDTIVAWHEQTFPLADEKSQKARFLEERQEFYESKNIEELADMTICAMGFSRFNKQKYLVLCHSIDVNRKHHRFTSDEVIEAINKKMAINRQRAKDNYWKYDKQTKQYVARHKLTGEK